MGRIGPQSTDIMFAIPVAAQSGFVFGLIALATLLMASNRVRYDFVALLVVLSLMLSGVLTVSESLAGFGNSTVILIAGLLVIGEMLDRTGVARSVGDWILKKGGSNDKLLLITIMVSSALLGAVMSSTAIVAIFIPIVLRIAKQTSLSASKLLMPMSFAALSSGMLTLIATPPNLVISGELRDSGFEPLGFFSFSLPGLIMLGLTVLYILVLGRFLLQERKDDEQDQPDARSLKDLWQDYRVDRKALTLLLPTGTPLCHKSLAEAALNTDYRVRILGVVRSEGSRTEYYGFPVSSFRLCPGDQFIVVGLPENIERMAAEKRLIEHKLSARDEQRLGWEFGGLSVLIHPNSRLVGHSIKCAGFRTQFGLDVFGLRRHKKTLADFEEVNLAPFDSLLIVGPWPRLKKLKAQNHNFVLLEAPVEATEATPEYGRMSVALIILTAMVAMSIFDLVPLVAAVLIAAIMGVVSRCLSAQDAYRSIHWGSLVLLAGMLPLADALQKTGGTDQIVSGLVHLVGDAGPGILLTALFFITVLLTNVISNTATAVFMAPIAISTAETLGVSPYPLAMGVLFAASSAFLTPVASSVVTLIVEPGRYRFTDFLKLGAPLVLIIYLATYFLVPIFFPW